MTLNGVIALILRLFTEFRFSAIAELLVHFYYTYLIFTTYRNDF